MTDLSEDVHPLDIAKEISNLGLVDAIVQTGFVTDEQKVNLMKNAQALVFPSLYEGFGLPILEAQSLGLPVLTSKTSSIPEVSADSVEYIEPNYTSSIVEGMNNLKNESRRLELAELGKSNCQRFSWEKAAKETYESLTSK